ncbi:MAG: hypothetical protein OES26_23490 [Gammaproteobacteria bacterium]|nr:hypothetical protein [Gammaproteobacteria bacterium]
MEFISDGLRGREPLWKVFWLYTVVLGLVLTVIFEMVLDNLGTIGWTFVVGVAALWGLWVLLSLWQCAYQTEWRGWAIAARTGVILIVIVIVVEIASLLGGRDLLNLGDLL